MGNFNNPSELAIAASQKEKEKKYWLDKLAGNLVKNIFPYDYKPGGNIPKMASLSFQLAGETQRRLMKLSNNSDTRLYVLLVTGLLVLLEKYTGNRDIIVGAPIYKQEKAAEADVKLINTVLILRNRLDDHMTFKELILQVSKTIFEAAEHQNYPLKILMNQLNMEYSETDFSLFDIGILLENFHDPRDIEHIHLNMVFSFAQVEERIKGKLTYNSLRYHDSSIRHITGHFLRLLEEAVFNIDSPLPEIDMLSKEEKNRLLFELNETKEEFPIHKTIDELFEEQVVKSPRNMAAEHEDNEISYREMNEKANRLARLLRRRGIKEDAIAGVLAERSVDMLVGMMAVLKAGGAYLPVSTGSPWARLKFLLEDSGASVLLTQKKLYERNSDIGKLFSPEDVFLTDEEAVYKGDESNLEVTRESNRLAYVIYTSGTTGKPKGVMIEHASLINFIYSMNRDFNGEFGSRDRCLSITNISFDVSVCELFLPLVFGAAVVFLWGRGVFDPEELSKTIVEKRITFAYLPPGLLKEVCKQLGTYGPGVVLDKLLVGVEPIKDEVLAEYREPGKNMNIVNGYGPTETTICATSYMFNSHKCRGVNVPIGKPLANTKILLLNKRHNLFPFGIPGELCVSGAGLARGYLNRPDLTAERFVDNPFFPGERMYKTGDFARWLPDGNMEFLGRIDNQVKIRGYRIEPGEIENKLLDHEAVKKAVIIDREDNNGNKYLCAYVVYHPAAEEPKIPQLIDFLSDELLSYMIPQRFVRLDDIPLTANGKVDRKALPDPREISEVEYVAPSTKNEKIIADIWKEILKLDRVGIYDNFFEIGGNSLSIVKLKTRLISEFGREIPDVKLLEYPTIGAFHNYLSREVLGIGSDFAEEVDPYEADDSPANKLKLRSKIMEEGVNA